MKSLEKIVIGLGLWLAVLPFLGFPLGWKSVLTAATGIVLMYLGALLYRKFRMMSAAANKVETRTETFTETL